MADTRPIRPLHLIRKLEIVVGGYAFEILVVVLPLDLCMAYPLLLGWPWLRTAYIKQNLQHNNNNFRCGREKIRVPTHEIMPSLKEKTPLYAEVIHMLKGLEDEEVEKYLEDNPRLILLFEIDVIETTDAYEKAKETEEDHSCEPNAEAVEELPRVQEAFDHEMEVSRRVTASTL